MNSTTKNILIGLFGLIATGIIVFMLLFLHPTVGDDGKRLRVRFTNIDKVNVGTRVTYAGHPVGEVVSIQEIANARKGRVAKNGEVYVYELVLDVDSSVNVFNTDTLSVQTSGLLGERNVEITPRAAGSDEELKLVNDTLLYAVPAGSVEDTLNQIEDISKKFSVILTDAQDILASVKHENLIPALGQAAHHIASVTQSLNQPEKWNHTLDQITSFVDKAHRSLDQVNSTLTTFSAISQKAERSWESVDRALEEILTGSAQFKNAATEANNALAGLNQGQGSLGQLLKGDEIYLRFKSLLYKGETIFDDIKRFGILFQLDKRWQRLQARRLHLADTLNTPQAFSHYFERELDRLHLSVANVSSALEEAGTCPDSLMTHPTFKCRFSQLLQEAGELEDSLNLYNTLLERNE